MKINTEYKKRLLTWYLKELEKNNLILCIPIVLLIGVTEVLTIYSVMWIVLLCLVCINFLFFFYKEKEKVKRELQNKTNFFCNLNINLAKKIFIFPWIKSSITLIIIMTIMSYILGNFHINYPDINLQFIFRLIFVLFNNQPYLYIIIIVIFIQGFFILFSQNKRGLKEISCLLGYLVTLRFVFLLLLNLIFAFGIEEITLSLSIYEILNRSEVLCNILAWLEPKVFFLLQPKGLITVLDDLAVKRHLNKLVNLFIEKYKPLYFNRITPFQFRFLYKLSFNKSLLVKSKLLDSGCYRSQFQPYTLPQVISYFPFITEFRLNNNLSSSSLDCKTYVCNWDDRTWVGSDYDSETVVGSENSLDSNLCKNIIKIRDPQLNFSEEYLNNNRIQSVFVNKGKARATSLDFNLDSEDNSQNIIDNTGSNEVTGSNDEDVTIAINQSRQTHEYNSRVGESSSRGAQGLYGQSQNNSSSSDDYENKDLEEWADRLALMIPRSSSSLTTMNSLDLNEMELELEFEKAGEDQVEQNLPQGFDSSSFDISLLNSEQFKGFDFSNLTDNLIPTHISDYDLTKCEMEFRLFLETINIGDLFDSELLNEFKEIQGQDENGDIYLNFSDSDIYSEINNSSSEEVIPRDRRVKSKIIRSKSIKKKVHKNKYYEMSYLLSARKNNLITSIKNSNVITEKRLKFENLNKLYQEILKRLRENKASDDSLENMRGEIESFSEKILGFVNKKSLGPLSYRVRGAKKEIYTSIHKTKSHLVRRVKQSNWDDKDIKIKMLNKKIESIRSMVKNDSSDRHNDLKNKVTAKLNKLKLDYQNNIKWSNRSFLLSTENADRLNLLLLLYQKIRLDLIGPFSIQMRPRIYKASLSNGDDVYWEFINEIRNLKKEMYSSSNIKYALHLVLKKLIELNEKHKYNNVKDSTIYIWNNRIINLLKKIIKDIIRQ